MNEEKKVKFKGVIAKAVFKSDTFSVYGVNVDKIQYPNIIQNKYGNTSISGDLHDLVIGTEYEIEAIEQETKFGVGYKVLNIKRDLPTTTEETYIFLSEILTENQARTLVDNYPNILQMVKNNDLSNVDLSKLKGIGEKTFEKIKDKIIKNYCLMELVIEFKNVLSMNMIKKIYDRYTSINKLKEKLKNEPYTTLTRISRVGFKSADSIIAELQKENVIDFGYDVMTSPDRCLACMLYLLEENEGSGNTKMMLTELRKKCLETVAECAHHFVDVVKDERIYYNKETMDVALKKTFESEKYIADCIKYGLSVNRVWDFDWKSYQNKGDYELSDEQIELLHAVCENNIVILTGGAGMGKSASTKMLIKMLADNEKSYILAAPTGKSAKVLKDFSETDAKTIHRTLGFNPSAGWEYNQENKLDCDVLLIDEMSMISVDLMIHVIDAIDFDRTKLVMIGDPNQLPSVQCGNLLFDFLMSKVIPIVRLTKVFRYGSGGILTAATDVIRGNQYIPKDSNKVVSIGSDNGYTFIKSDDNSIVAEVVSLYKKLITDGMSGCVYKPEEIAVLTAYNKGDYGAVTLNQHLQKIANKNYGSEYHMKHGSTIYYADDIIMQLANNYNMEVYDEEDETAFVANGECSKISLIGRDFMVSDFDDMRIKYHKEDLSDVALSYSYTIHKSQGSTIKVVIVVSPRSHVYMSTMNLLYVGITRASDKCYHFGLPSTINMAMKKKENFNRMTFMQEMLKNN